VGRLGAVCTRPNNRIAIIQGQVPRASIRVSLSTIGGFQSLDGVSSRLRHMKIVSGNYPCVDCPGGGSRLVQCDGLIIRGTFAAVCFPRRWTAAAGVTVPRSVVPRWHRTLGSEWRCRRHIRYRCRGGSGIEKFVPSRIRIRRSRSRGRSSAFRRSSMFSEAGENERCLRSSC
jgi:hypothetical protein